MTGDSDKTGKTGTAWPAMGEAGELEAIFPEARSKQVPVRLGMTCLLNSTLLLAEMFVLRAAVEKKIDCFQLPVKERGARFA